MQISSCSLVFSLTILLSTDIISKIVAAGPRFKYRVYTLAGNNAGTSNGPGTFAEFNQPVDLAVDNLKNVYVADRVNRAIRKISMNGDVTTSYKYDKSDLLLYGLSVDKITYKLYASDSHKATVFSVFNNMRADVRKNGWSQLTGLDVSKSGDIFVCSQKSAYIFSSSSNSWSSISTASCLSPVFRDESTVYLLNGDASSSSIKMASKSDNVWTITDVIANLNPQISSMAIDPEGENLYIADYKDHVIRKINIASKSVDIFAGRNGILGKIDGIVSIALFRYPKGVAVDSDGDVYVADFNHRIRKIVKCPSSPPDYSTCTVNGFTCISGYKRDTNTGYNCVKCPDNYQFSDGKTCFSYKVTTLAGNGAQGLDDGSGNEASFDFPVALAVDSQKNVYVADRTNGRIRKITQAVGAVNVLTLVHSLSSPNGVALINSDDSLLISDGDKSSTVYKYESGQQLSPMYSRQFSGLVGIAVSNDGRKTVICTGNSAKYSSDGVNFEEMGIPCRKAVFDKDGLIYMALDVDTTPGNCIVKVMKVKNAAGVEKWEIIEKYGDGFQRPLSLDIDKEGRNLFVSDFENHVIKKINIASKSVEIIAGKIGEFGFANGDITTATFHGPHGIAVDSDGDIYVAGYYNQKIRKILRCEENSSKTGC